MIQFGINWSASKQSEASSYSSSIIRSKIVCLGKCSDSLKVSETFLSVKSNNGAVNIFLAPKVNLNSLPHIFENISFGFSSEILFVCQDLLLSLMIIFCFQQQSAWQSFNVHFFSWRKRNIWTAVFNCLSLELNFLKCWSYMLLH